MLVLLYISDISYVQPYDDFGQVIIVCVVSLLFCSIILQVSVCIMHDS